MYISDAFFNSKKAEMLDYINKCENNLCLLDDYERKIIVYEWIKTKIEEQYCIHIINDIKLLIYHNCNKQDFMFDTINKSDTILLSNNNGVMSYDGTKSKNNSRYNICVFNKAFNKRDYSVNLRINEMISNVKVGYKMIIGCVESDKISEYISDLHKSSITNKRYGYAVGIDVNGQILSGYDDKIDLIINYNVKHNDINIGDHYGCFDTHKGYFRVIKIIHKNDYGIQVHWIGWSNKWDEFIQINSYINRIKKLKTPILPYGYNDEIEIKYICNKENNECKIRWIIKNKTQIPKEHTLEYNKIHTIFVCILSSLSRAVVEIL